MKSGIKKIVIVILIMICTIMASCGEKKTKIITDNVNQTRTVKNENKSKKDFSTDKTIYKGYKGPVQGEIKYQEGRPAKQNSEPRKASGDIGSPYHVDLMVTRDYGHTKMFAKNVGLVKDEVGMEVLFRNLDIQTAYGGGFVNTINGLESSYTFYTGSQRKKLDWFYWVNGILAPIGVAEYRPHPGDVVWWDYHNWDVTMFFPAVVGSYPQPFKNGFGGKNPGTVIMYTPSFKNEAQKLKDSLIKKGVKTIDIFAYQPELIEQPKKYYILLGKWDDLSKKSNLVQQTNLKSKLVGVYINFKDGKLNALDQKGKVIKTYDKAGAIYGYASGLGSIKPLWLITGTDDESVRDSVNILLNKPESIYQYFDAVVTKDGVVNVPYVN